MGGTINKTLLVFNTFAIDFFTVPTATFEVLYVFVIIWHKNSK